MSSNFTEKLGRLIGAPEYSPILVADYNRSARRMPLLDRRPVLQVNAFPITLNPKNYENPHSNTNPNGSYTSLYEFSQLVNPIPSFTEYYSPSLNTISSVYKNLLHGASVRRGEIYTDSVFSSALESYDSGHFSNMGGIPGNWYPTYATPVDWYDTSNLGRFREISINLTNDDSKDDKPYRIIKSNNNDTVFSTMTKSLDGSSKLIDKNTLLKSVEFRYLEVRLNRPWLNFEIFNLDGWFISGQNAGYFSNGSAKNNNGTIPLITTSILIGIDVKLEAKWSKKDKDIIDNAKNKGERITVGPFVTNSEMISKNELHIIGRISQLVPLSPKVDG